MVGTTSKSLAQNGATVGLLGTRLLMERSSLLLSLPFFLAEWRDMYIVYDVSGMLQGRQIQW